MSFRGSKIGNMVCLGKLISDPNYESLFRLDQEHATWVHPLESLSARVKVGPDQFTDNSSRVLLLVAHEGENARVDCQGEEIGV